MTRYALMIEPRVLTKAGIRLRLLDPEVKYEVWSHQWFEGMSRNGIGAYHCRIEHCNHQLTSSEPDRQRLHILQHFARPVCGICLFTSPNTEGMSKHFNTKHKRFGNTISGRLHGVNGARFWVSRANLPKLGDFIRAMSFGNPRRYKKLIELANSDLLCAADYLPPQE